MRQYLYIAFTLLFALNVQANNIKIPLSFHYVVCNDACRAKISPKMQEFELESNGTPNVFVAIKRLNLSQHRAILTLIKRVSEGKVFYSLEAKILDEDEYSYPQGIWPQLKLEFTDPKHLNFITVKGHEFTDSYSLIIPRLSIGRPKLL